MDNLTRYRILLVLALLLITPAGFYAKLYGGPMESWFNNSFSNILYVVFWCLIGSLLLSKVKPFTIALVVLLITNVLEFLQLFDYYLLSQVRQYFIGHVLIGTTFVWMDFLYYGIGAGLGWGLLRLLRSYTSSPDG